MKKNQTFTVKDSILITISTGVSIQNLRELRQALITIPGSSIYHHFWGRLLRPSFDEPEYNNDFASWVQHSIHDKLLAERFSAVNPAHYNDIEELRHRLIDLIEERFDESELIEWKKGEFQFNFLDSQVLVIETGIKVSTPEKLSEVLMEIPEGAVYYHFIDARRRTDNGQDDFSNWMCDFGKKYENLCSELSNIDPYFSSLKHIRKLIATLFDAHLRKN